MYNVRVQSRSEVFPATTGGVRELCARRALPLLGALPLDPLLARCCDAGQDYTQELPAAPAALALHDIVNSEYNTLAHPHTHRYTYT